MRPDRARKVLPSRVTALQRANEDKKWTVVVAQLVERSLPTPEVRGLIPIGEINIDQYSTNCNLEKTKINKKRPGMAHL